MFAVFFASLTENVTPITTPNGGSEAKLIPDRLFVNPTTLDELSVLSTMDRNEPFTIPEAVVPNRSTTKDQGSGVFVSAGEIVPEVAKAEPIVHAPAAYVAE